MTEKHTPGPWTIIPASEYSGDDPDLDGSFTSPASIEGADGNPVCTFGSEDGSGTLFENEADYHLIVAAPTMLGALKEAREQTAILQGRLGIVDPGHGTLSIIDAAIAKAEGRSS